MFAAEGVYDSSHGFKKKDIPQTLLYSLKET